MKQLTTSQTLRTTARTKQAKAASLKPRTQPADIRRQALMDASERIFLKKGAAATTIEDITGEAGVAKGTFYLYFNSKEDLLAALRERFVDRLQARTHELGARQAPNDWLARLDAWVEGGVQGYVDNLQLHDVLFHGDEYHPQQPSAHSHYKLVFALAELLREGSTAQAWHLEDPNLTAVFLYHAFHGVVDHALSEGRLGTKALIRATQHLFRQALSLNTKRVR
jgi:AcrR family transcriptional regulator